MSRRLVSALLLSATFGTACATGEFANVEKLVVQDAVQLGVAALAAKLGVNNSTVSAGVNTAQNIYSSSNKTAAAKSAAAKVGTDKIASLTGLTAQQKQLAEVGISDLLR